jgi:hypothetical protein
MQVPLLRTYLQWTDIVDLVSLAGIDLYVSCIASVNWLCCFRRSDRSHRLADDLDEEQRNMHGFPWRLLLLRGPRTRINSMLWCRHVRTCVHACMYARHRTCARGAYPHRQTSSCTLAPKDNWKSRSRSGYLDFDYV